MLQTCPHGNYRWIPLYCHRWTCDICGPHQRDVAIARLCHAFRVGELTGSKLKLVTLTYNHDVQRTTVLTTLQHLAQSIRRHYKLFEYARFPEYTKAGRIHLHLVVMAPFIPQADLSKRWRAASHGSYITDIRTIQIASQLAGHVTRYLTKGPAGKITYSRHFPNFPDLEDHTAPDGKGPAFIYEYHDIHHAVIASGASLALWTGEPVYINGP